MIIHSDWHIHSEYSYDAENPLELIALKAKQYGIQTVGITDHANYNDEKFLGDLRRSAAAVRAAQEKYPFMVLGVELTPIEKPEFDHIARFGTRDGYTPPPSDHPFGIELACSKEELMALGVRYAIGASHARIDSVICKKLPKSMDVYIKEWYRQQIFLACDERVTILGHPWYQGEGIWYEDLSVIPHSMQLDIGAALKENGKYVECNAHFFLSKKATEKFRHQYAELLREFFEMGIPVTYGSDSHQQYADVRDWVEQYLIPAGFSEGDFSELSEQDLW